MIVQSRYISTDCPTVILYFHYSTCPLFDNTVVGVRYYAHNLFKGKIWPQPQPVCCSRISPGYQSSGACLVPPSLSVAAPELLSPPAHILTMRGFSSSSNQLSSFPLWTCCSLCLVYSFFLLHMVITFISFRYHTQTIWKHLFAKIFALLCSL